MDEKKTYLVNVESNLKKYSDEAAEAKKRVDELKETNKKLTESGTASASEIEKNNAALRNAQKEYNQAKKMVDLQTAANKSETGSRKQLSEILRLQEQELGKLSHAYIINAKGVRELNPLYIEQRNRIAATKQSIIDYDLALNDGRTNVGRYSESIKGALGNINMLPGPLGRAAMSVQTLGKAFLALIASPIVLVLVAITAALYSLAKALKATDTGATELQSRMEQLKSGISVYFQFISQMGKYEGDIVKHFKNAARAAYDYQQALDKLNDAQINFISEEKQMEARIAALQLISMDSLKTDEERIKALESSIEIEKTLYEKRIGFAKTAYQEELKNVAAKYDIDEKLLNHFIQADDKTAAMMLKIDKNLATARNQMNDDQHRKLEELYVKEFELIDTRDKGLKRSISRLSGLYEETNKKNETSTKKSVEEINKAELQFHRDRLKREEEYRKEIEDGLDVITQALIDEVNERIAQDERTDKYNAEQLKKEKQLAEDKIQIEKDLHYMKYQIASDFAGAISGLFEENTVASKLAAVAQATINTYLAGVKAMADLPVGSTPFLRFAAMAAVIAAGLVQVKNILAVKTSGASSAPSSGANTVIYRTAATPVGSTIFTQPQLTQSQLNAIPQQMSLTAQDIADAVGNLPPPIVTVEDINVKISEVKKVNMRATI